MNKAIAAMCVGLTLAAAVGPASAAQASQPACRSARRSAEPHQFRSGSAPHLGRDRDQPP